MNATNGAAAAAELEILFPDDGTVVIGEETLVIKPIKFKQVKQVLKLAEKLKGRRHRYQDEPQIGADGVLAKQAEAPAMTHAEMLGIINENSEVVTEALAVAVGKPVAFIDDLDVTDVVKLLAVVLKVNSDFFTTHALPMVMKILEDVTPKLVAVTSAGQKLQ